MRLDLRMYIRTWPAATPMHLYSQVNANTYDSDLPYAQDADWVLNQKSKQKVEFGGEKRPPYAH